MAIFHLTTKVFSRGKGQSAIAAAAYRSGERLTDEATGEQKYYQARSDRIEFTGMFVPANAPAWAQDRNAFWNRAEQAEPRKDARLAREIEVALPHELTPEQRLYLVKDFVREAFVRKGYVADVAIHDPDRTSDERNTHAHILISERRIGPEGFAAKKDPAMNSKGQLGEWREQWAHLANRHLERHGHDARIDHRSLRDQGVDREPTMHVGYAAAEIAARGAQSDRMDELRAILDRNDIRVEIKAIDGQLAGLVREAAEEEKLNRAAISLGPDDWTDRGGMVAQQDSAMKDDRRRDTGLMADFVSQRIKDQAAREEEVRRDDPNRERDRGRDR